MSLSNAGVRYGERWIFRNLTLDVTRGACLALLGPNGRGKTSLIRALLGVQRLSEGQRCAPDIIGYVPQISSTLVKYSVVDMVVMGRTHALGIFGTPARTDYERAREMLRLVGMVDFADHPYHKLSGGERQLVLLARALATGAGAIVLDEPASALDFGNQARLLSILNRLRERGDYTLLFSTHLPQHALHVADRTLLMMPSEEILVGPTSAILTEQNLQRLYGVPIRRVQVAGADALIPLFSAPLASRGCQ